MPTDDDSHFPFPYSEWNKKPTPRKPRPAGQIKAQFSYKENDRYTMMDDVTYDQIGLDAKLIGPAARFLKEGQE